MENEKTLSINRTVDVSANKLYQCWTDPELLKQWFTPKPWSTVAAELDLRTGGSSKITMRSPDGVDMPNLGVYLEVIPNKKIVFTDAYTSAWVPSDKPFFTAVVTFDAIDESTTNYTATALHWTTENCEAHKAMGFHSGWNMALDQLVALAKTL